MKVFVLKWMNDRGKYRMITGSIRSFLFNRFTTHDYLEPRFCSYTVSISLVPGI